MIIFSIPDTHDTYEVSGIQHKKRHRLTTGGVFHFYCSGELLTTLQRGEALSIEPGRR